MSNLSDKDIDRLSRNAAEFYEPDDSMLSWNKLEQHLVEHIPERPPDTLPFFSIRSRVWIPAVLLLAGISYYIIKNANHSQVSTLQTQSESGRRNTAPGNGAEPFHDHSLTVNPHATDSSAANVFASGMKPKSEHFPDAALAKTSAAEAITGNRNSLNNSKRKPVAGRAGGKISSGNSSLLKHIPGKTAGPETIAAKRKKHPALLRGVASAKNRKPNNHQLSSDEASVPLISAPDGSKQNAEDQRDRVAHLPMPVVRDFHPMVKGNDSSLNRYGPATIQKPSLPKSLQINHSLTIGIVMGPDHTQVGGMPNNQLSNNLGVSVGYYITSRLSVNTGFQYTTKYYWADGKLFQPQSTNGLTTAAYAFPRIESVNGSCNMFEIPLTLRYDFLHQGKTRLFAGAGLSSYLMRKQQYTYFFHNSGRAYEWENENNEHLHYWMAIGNFSAGIEQDFGKGFSFQAEPFLRLPFRGVGVGNMKMNSFGLLFSMRYSPVLERTRK